MNITIATYDFNLNLFVLKQPFEIIKETSKCYFTKNSRYLKADLGAPILRNATSYPYIELVMVDADEEALTTRMSAWFTDKANEILTGECTFNIR